MKNILCYLSIFFSLSCIAGEVHVFDKSFIDNPNSVKVDKDHYGHGTHITNIILQSAPNTAVVQHITSHSVQLIEDLASLPTHKRVVVNMSFVMNQQIPCPAYLDKAITEATKRGAIFVVSAGNNHIPANYGLASCANVIVVGAASNGKPADYSNYGENVTAFAAEPIVNNQVYRGTSFTTPVVTALISKWLDDQPTLTFHEIKQHLMNNTDIKNYLLLP